MTGDHWLVVVAGREDGAGFLIDERRVLTCAHLVHGAADVTVEIPHRRDIQPTVTVAFDGWDGHPEDDQRPDNDLAVLILDPAVSPEIGAKFAPLTLLERRLKLPSSDPGVDPQTPRTLAVRWGHAAVSVGVKVDRSPNNLHVLQAPDANQVAHIVGGYSGAPVLDGEFVIGMVTGHSPAIHGGQMLSLQGMVECWPELADIVPLRGPYTTFAPGAYAQLRELLGHLSRDRALSLWSEFLLARDELSFGRRYGEWLSPLALAESIVTNPGLVSNPVQVRSQLRDFLTVCADEEATIRDGLHGWIREHLGVPTAAPAAPRTLRSIIVMVADTNDESYFDVGIWEIDGRRDLTRGDQPSITHHHVGRLRHDEVRVKIEKSLAPVLDRVGKRDVMLEFALPKRWREALVHDWSVPRDVGARLPFGRGLPVVIRSTSRFLDHRWNHERQWDFLHAHDGADRSGLEWVTCDEARDDVRFTEYAESEEDHFAMGLYALDPPEILDIAIDRGVPVMLWPTVRCRDHTSGRSFEGECAGATLGAEIRATMQQMTDMRELPQHVYGMRKAAGRSDTATGHCGRHLVLFWDDPYRRPPEYRLQLTEEAG
jgi:hypothetical protein